MVIFLYCFLGVEFFYHLPSTTSPVDTIWIPNSNRILSYVSLDFKQGYFCTVIEKDKITERTCMKMFNMKQVISNLILKNQTKSLSSVTATIERSYIVLRHFTAHLKISLLSCFCLVLVFLLPIFQWDVMRFLTHSTYVLFA